MDDPQTPEHPSFRAGFVAIAGRPNVGKSTLVNALVGQKIAAVTPRPQTTRRQQFGIVTRDDAQLIFVDAPGVHRPRHKLGEWMNEEAAAAIHEADAILILVDGSQPVQEEDHLLAELLQAHASQLPQILAINKADLIPADRAAEVQGAFAALFPSAEPIVISATRGDNLETLVERLRALLPEGPPFFSPEQITDLYERDIAADLIREAALLHLRDEVPHSLAIRIDEFTERGDHGALIRATLLVERESQKPIVIGQNGEMIKRIGKAARIEIERMSGRKVYLDLRVKVRPNWRNNERVLKQFGFRSR